MLHPGRTLLELEQLRHVLNVADLHSFTRAAVKIGLSQPALSRSIAKLEVELGQPLFARQTRNVVLTDAGSMLVERARQILTLVDDAKAEISEDGETGRVRVAAIPTVAPYFLPSCLQSFQQVCPRAQVVVQEDTTDNLLKKVADGDVDVAIAARPITAKYLDVVKLFDEELLLVTSKNHPLAKQATVRATDLDQLPFVLLGEAHCLSDNIVSFCRQKSFHPVSVERTSQLAMVQELVALNHGISLVPAMARVRDTSKQRIYRSLTGPKPMRTIVMITNPYRYHSRLVEKFQEHVKQQQPIEAESTTRAAR